MAEVVGGGKEEIERGRSEGGRWGGDCLSRPGPGPRRRRELASERERAGGDRKVRKREDDKSG
jgi:hypothetical protein